MTFTSAHVTVDRQDVLGSAMEQLPYTFSIANLDANFKGEAGMNFHMFCIMYSFLIAIMLK